MVGNREKRVCTGVLLLYICIHSHPISQKSQSSMYSKSSINMALVPEINSHFTLIENRANRVPLEIMSYKYSVIITGNIYVLIEDFGNLPNVLL